MIIHDNWRREYNPSVNHDHRRYNAEARERKEREKTNDGCLWNALNVEFRRMGGKVTVTEAWLIGTEIFHD